MTEPSQEREYDEVYDGPDPDVQSIEEAAAEQDDEGLTTDELRPEEDVTEFEPPSGPSTPQATAPRLRSRPFSEPRHGG